VNTIVSVQATIEINGDINVSNLSRQLDQENINKLVLKAAIENLQEDLVNHLCGERYTRDPERRYWRAGTAKRTLVTRHGTITLKIIKVRSTENGSIMRPLLLYLGVEPRVRIVDDLVLESAEAATYLTYRDTVTVIEALTKAETSKHRVHRYVQQVGTYMDEERRKTQPDKVDHMYSDGTKAHGLNGKKNTVNVVMGKDRETGGKTLLALDVNRSWRETAIQVTSTADVLVSDADREMRYALIDKVLRYQLCVNHAVKDVNNHLWRAEMPYGERKEIRARLRSVLRILRNSARKHLKDKNFERLRWRIDWALEELRKLAGELREEGFTGAAKFIVNSANYMVTFAELAMKKLYVPYTNNLIERLMGEVAKRVKNRWMHWSTTGLYNMLSILLVRYCDKELYHSLKRNFYKDEGSVIIVKVA